jgi:hypothetical protein
LPLINSRAVDLLDSDRLGGQLLGLERRTSRGGRDSVDHRVGGHDDLCNAAAGALVHAMLLRASGREPAAIKIETAAQFDPHAFGWSPEKQKSFTRSAIG